MWTDRSNPIRTKIDGHAIPVILGVIGGLGCFSFSSGDHGTMCFKFGDGDARPQRVRPPSDRSRVGRDVIEGDDDADDDGGLAVLWTGCSRLGCHI